MPASAHTYPTVAVVLCTRNGERWIEEQLHSLLAQTWPIAVRVFDDASSDNASSQGRDVQCHVRNNALGVVDNFFDGLQQVLDEGFTYIALCDQDDVWLPQRIEIGMEKLLAAEQVENAPAAQLVHSDLTMVDAQNALLHPSFIAWRGYEVGISHHTSSRGCART